MTRVCFLTPSRGNSFMTDLLAGVAEEVASAGAEVSFATDRFPADDPAEAYVAIPHEFFSLAPDFGSPAPRQLHRVIGFCVEQPGTPWFGTTWHYAKQLGAQVDIRRSVVREMRRRGLPVEHFQVGYHAGWDRWGRDEAAPRAVDVLYLGSHDDRRARILAGYAETLQGRRARLLIPPEAPKPAGRLDYLTGAARWQALAGARTLLNVHRRGVDLLEWPRVVESICNGCVVVSEHSVDAESLVAGEHYLSGAPENLALLAAGLLDDEARLTELRLGAYDFLRSELTMRDSAQRLLAIAEQLTKRPGRLRPEEGLAPEPVHVDERERSTKAVRDALIPVRAALKQISIEATQLRRRMEALELGMPWPTAHRSAPAVVAQTPAYPRAEPRVTVVVPLYNYETEVVAALGSVTASEDDSYEIVVLDDASTDGSADAVRGFLAEHPWLPAVLLRHSINCGLGRTRNALVERARGEYVFMLDADNEIYPSTLGRLVAALQSDPEAMFAYPTIAVYEAGEPVDLLSAQAWDPELLREHNVIDAMALLRRADLRALGGYAEDPRLVGWEDYDLWCRVADAGRHGVHVPEILAAYRRSAHSLLNLTALDLTVARSIVATRAPGVFRTDERPSPAVA